MSNNEILTLQEKRAKIVKDCQAIDSLSKKENRDRTSEESDQINRGILEAQKLRVREDQLRDLETLSTVRESRIEAEAEQRSVSKDEVRDVKQDVLNMYRQYLCGRVDNRSLQTAIDVDGGYISAPQMVVAELLKDLSEISFARRLGRVIPTGNADSLGVPSRTTSPTVVREGELDTTTASTIKFGKRELHPSRASTYVTVSEKLLQVSSVSVDSLVNEEFVQAFTDEENVQFCRGSGASGNWLGLFTASSDGISTSRDITNVSSQTAFTVADMLSLREKVAYTNRVAGKSGYLIGDQSMSIVLALADGDGRYLFNPASGNGGDTIFGEPIYYSSACPNNGTLSTGEYWGVYAGDWSKYWVASMQGFSLRRFEDSTVAIQGLVGFLGRKWDDGMPVLETYFARAKTA